MPGAAFTALVGLTVSMAAVPAASAAPADEPAPAATAAPAPAVAPEEPLTAADAISAAAIARLMDAPVEILGERTEFGSVYALPNGTKASGQGSGPVWVRQGGDGTAAEDWAAVDLTLELGEDGLVRPVAQSADLVLSGGTPEGAAAAQAAARGAVEQTANLERPEVEGAAVGDEPAAQTPTADEPAVDTEPDATPTGEPAPDATPEPTPAGTPAAEPQDDTATDAPDAGADIAAPLTEVASVTDPASGLVTRVQWEGTLPTPTLSGRRATYESVEPGTDLVIEATSTGFEQFFVIHERPEPGADVTFPLTVTTDGAEVEVAEDGSLTIETAAGEAVAAAPVPYMWDAESDNGRAFPVTKDRPAEAEDSPRLSPMPDFVGEREAATADTPQAARRGASKRAASPDRADGDAASGRTAPGIVGDGKVDPRAEAVEVERETEKVATDEVTVELAPSEEFLQSPDTVYPVVVDPDVNLNWGFDTYVIKGYSNNRSEEGELRVGTYDGGAHVTRSFIHFPMGQFAGATVYSARMELFNFYSWSCQARTWEVWNVYPAGPGSTWTNQPGWAHHYANSSETHGYSSACGGSWSNADITSFAQMWAASNETEGHVGVKAQSETDNFGWKRFYSSNNGAYIPSIWVNYNHAPNTPTGLSMSHTPSGSTNGSWISSLTPTMSATLTDPNGGNIDGNFYLRSDATGQIIQQTASGFVPNGGVAQVQIAPGKLVENGVYRWQVRGSDWQIEGPPTHEYWFRVDTRAPLAPRISSATYPNDNAWHGGENVAGAFTVTPPGADHSALTYRWGLDKAPDPNQTVAASTDGTPSTITVTPTTPGRHSLRVQAVDRAGNVSGIVEHVFYVGRAGILTPLDDTRVVSRTRLYVTGESVFNRVQFQWRRGPDSPATAVRDVPPSLLTTSDGTAWPVPVAPATNVWAPLPTGSSAYTTLDIGALLGHDGGPLQVRAVVAEDASGKGRYEGQWITLVVDPDASGAATSGVGPGSVNLLTGDHTLAVTDAEEFGLTLARTTSSRDTDSGYELQADKLSVNQREAKAVESMAGSAVVAVDTTRFHTGTSSYRLTPTGSTADTYTGIGLDAGAMRLGLQAGRTYRVSGWIYVPESTGLQPDFPRGLGLAVFTRTGTGPYSEPASNGSMTARPTRTDVWQQISVDVTIPAGSTEAFVRLYNGFSGTSKHVYFDDLSVRELWAPFGKEWASGTIDSAAGTAYTHISRPYDDVAAVHLTGGGEIWFTSGNGGATWWPEPGAESLRLTSTSPTTWRLTEIDATTTDFERKDPKAQDALVTVTSPPGATGASRHVYDLSSGQARLTRIIAPIEDGVDGWPANRNACNPVPGTAPVRGCEVMDLVYATGTSASASTPGTVAGQVDQVRLWTTDPAGVVSAVPVSRYLYDGNGRLTKVWDLRIGTSTGTAPGTGTLVTTYAYDTSGRLTRVTAPGEEPFTFEYGKAGATRTGTGDFVDASGGRLLTVVRRALKQGTTDQWESAPNVTTVVYGVPLTRAKGGPYDLAAAQLATWAQTDGPTDATAVFGPQHAPTVTTATGSVPGADGYRAATVHYLNADGREVNTASPTTANGPVEGFIDTSEYDRFGNVVRTLDATNRLLALGRLPESAQLAGWGLGGTGSAYLSQVLDSRTVYSGDGLDVIASRGPAQRLAVGNDPDSLATLFPVTRSTYDEGKPDGLAYHLVTTETSGGLPIGADLVTGALQDVTVTKNRYDPIDQAIGDLDPTSGWVHKQPTAVTVDAGQPSALTSTIVYDGKGRPVRSSKPGSNGADATTTVSVLYVAGADPAGENCGNRPEWAGQPCLTKAAGAVTGHDAARMSGQLSRKRVAEYNRFGSPTIVDDSAVGPVAGATTTVTRRALTTYDAADRVTSVEITGTGAGVGAAVAKTTTVYDPATGDVTENRSVDAAGAVVAAVTKSYDRLGRLVSYGDGAGATTTTEYDRFGQPSKAVERVEDGFGERTIGETTYTYDHTKDARGFVTSFEDSVAGTFEAEWGPDGQLQTQKLPGGVTLSIGYDPARVPVSRTYTRASDGTRIAGDSVVENQRGQWVRHSSDTGVRDYEYDRLGRLTKVEDRLASTGVCTTRTYGFASATNPGSANRTSYGTASGTEGAPCVDPVATAASTYDTADRLLTSPGVAGSSWTYDPLGRVTSMATADGSATVTNGFYVNDLVASQTQANVEQMTWTLDPLQRRSVFESKKWVNDAWASAITKVSHYGSDSDEPSWIQEDSTLPDDLTRYVAGVEGDLAVTTKGHNDAGDKRGRVLQLVDLHGDVTATLPIADDAASATWSGLAFTSFDEFGNPQQLSGAGATTGPPARYGWLGAAQRSSEALGAVVLMGVRLYSAATGRFLSVDPVAGGSASAYDYCNADPVNCTDLAGTFSWKGALKALAVVGEVASFIPGPIGAAAAAVSSVAYLATGNKGKALEMGVTAAAQLVGAGPAVRVGFKVANTARKAGQAAQRAATKVSRAVKRIGKSCSFEAGTLVSMADGSSVAIESLVAGDLVLSSDPITGETQAQPVLAPIAGAGTKHMVRLTFTGSEGAVDATHDHPFWVRGTGWTAAAELFVGDEVLGSDSSVATVESVVDLGTFARHTVYNLSVAGAHSYYVRAGVTDVLVHNARPTSCSVTQNRTAGLAWEDDVAKFLRSTGAVVIQRPKSIMTPYGRRFPDIHVIRGGRLHAIEAKAGKSRYTAMQRKKDAWIEKTYGTKTTVVRRR